MKYLVSDKFIIYMLAVICLQQFYIFSGETHSVAYQNQWFKIAISLGILYIACAVLKEVFTVLLNHIMFVRITLGFVLQRQLRKIKNLSFTVTDHFPYSADFAINDLPDDANKKSLVSVLLLLRCLQVFTNKQKEVVKLFKAFKVVF